MNDQLTSVSSPLIVSGGTVSSIYLSPGQYNKYQYAISFQDGTGLSATIGQSTNATTKRVSPKLYFSYVKSKLSKLETKKLRSRLTKLQGLIKNAEDTGQTALYEQFSKMLTVAIRESEVLACGYGTFVHLNDINKFRHIVKENDKATVNPVEFKSLIEYPRSIPASIQKTIKAVQKKGIFEELWVLYLDYTKEPIKTNKEKIREKDPVLFGRLACDPDKFYFIADWIDEYCDLTLSQFIDTLQGDNEEFDLSNVEDLSPEYLERIKKEVQEREDRLQATRPNNFRDQMAAEDKAKAERTQKALEEANSKLALEEVARIHAEDRLKQLEDFKRKQDQKDADKRPWILKLFK